MSNELGSAESIAGLGQHAPVGGDRSAAALRGLVQASDVAVRKLCKIPTARMRPTGECFPTNFMQAHYQSTTALPAVTARADRLGPKCLSGSHSALIHSEARFPAAPSGDLAFSKTLNDVTTAHAEDGIDLKMDLYFSAIKPAGPAPVVMFVHGRRLGVWQPKPTYPA